MRRPLRLTVAELCEAVCARLLRGDPLLMLDGLSTDTRVIQVGELFIAIRGERFDGHHFLSIALAKGARAAMVDEQSLGEGLCRAIELAGIPVIVVGDTRRALGLLAQRHRLSLRVRVVGITGSNGKTTTKELLAAALAVYGSTHSTRGNFNNDVGLPLCLLELDPEHHFAVLEMGTSAQGEIAWLAELARPELGLVTNIAAAHTEGLGGIEGVAAAKGELYEAIGPDGVAVFNLDDPLVRVQVERCRAVRRLSFGRSPGADVRVIEAHAFERDGLGAAGILEVGGRRLPLHLRLIGKHNLFNAAAAAAACLGLGLDPEPALAAMEQVSAQPHRMDLRAVGDLLLLDDSYNANASSSLVAVAALAALASRKRAARFPARMVVVLGEMLELGLCSEELHRQVGRKVAELGVDLLITVGEQARWAGEEYRRTGPGSWVHLKEAPEVGPALAGWLKPGDHILLKGSRRVGLERVLADIEQMQATDGLSVPPRQRGAEQPSEGG